MRCLPWLKPADKRDISDSNEMIHHCSSKLFYVTEGSMKQQENEVGEGPEWLHDCLWPCFCAVRQISLRFCQFALASADNQICVQGVSPCSPVFFLEWLLFSSQLSNFFFCQNLNCSCTLLSSPVHARLTSRDALWVAELRVLVGVGGQRVTPAPSSFSFSFSLMARSVLPCLSECPCRGKRGRVRRSVTFSRVTSYPQVWRLKQRLLALSCYWWARWLFSVWGAGWSP